MTKEEIINPKTWFIKTDTDERQSDALLPRMQPRCGSTS